MLAVVNKNVAAIGPMAVHITGDSDLSLASRVVWRSGSVLSS